MKFNPEQSVSHLKGVGPKLQETLARLGIERMIDLLLHLPLRYQDRSRVSPMRTIRADEEHLFSGQVADCQTTFGKRRGLKVTLVDHTGSIVMRFFNYSRYQQNQLQLGAYVLGFGEFRFFGRELCVAHPEYQVFDDPPDPPDPTLTPIYPTTQGLGQTRIRQLINTLLDSEMSDAPGLPYQRLRTLHRPPADLTPDELTALQHSIALDELTAYFLVMQGRALRRRQEHALALPQAQGLGRRLLNDLGFKLTQAQGRVIAEVLADLGRAVPMLRLVQGDVGSGKTIVAAFAAIRAAEHGCQTAIMAPTELLAEQHFLNFKKWLDPLGLRVELLTGGLSKGEQTQRLTAIADGSAHIVLGTHALFQAHVHFQRLALVVIDEQHRFGVHQRMALQHKGDSRPHQLIMTATPIPRTLTMALYADMAVSIIDELPKGRQPITTHTVTQARRDEVIATVGKAVARGEQVYWVCTLIEPSDEIRATPASEALALLSQSLPHVRVGLLHGRMTSEEKNAVMAQFHRGDLHLLVATTVVEVGVDVPNATHMVIENAERLGLAQLHQLRGRVGRGNLPSHCFLLFAPGLTDAAKTRLNAMRESQDGFYLAEQDLVLRGPGDVLGTRQSGEQTFRVADLALHAALIAEAAARGERLLMASAHTQDYATLRNLLMAWAPSDSGALTV